ncbi:unnamed protein product, partial [Effrenium voratum]
IRGHQVAAAAGLSARRLCRTGSWLAASEAHQADPRAAATACWRRGRAADEGAT